MARRKSRTRSTQRSLFDEEVPKKPEEVGEQADRGPRLFLIDGSNFVFRAYYGLPPLSNSTGTPTGATYGFANMLMKMLREERPEYIAIVWDAEGPSFRDEIYAEYKANRNEVPPDLYYQFDNIHQMISHWNIKQIEIPDYEADDVIASLARTAAAQQIEVIIATSDKDLMQVVTDDIKILDTMKRKVYAPADVKEKLGVGPELVIDYLALVGDSSDNIPGIKGVGPKTALKLLEQFGSLAAILERTDEIERERLRDLVNEHRKSVVMSRELVELGNPKVDITLEELKRQPPDRDLLRELFEELEFGRLIREVGGVDIARDGYDSITTREELDALVEKLKVAPRFAFDTETTSLEPMSAKLVGVSVCADDHDAYYIPVGHTGPGSNAQLSIEDVRAALGPLLADPDKPKIAQNAKYDVLVLQRHGFEIAGHIDEPMLAAYCLNPTRQSFGLAALSEEYFGHTMISYEEVAGKGAKEVPFDLVGVRQATEYAAGDSHLTWLLWNKLATKLDKEPKLTKIYNDIELPLVPILMSMEEVGISVDVAALRVLSKEYQASLLDLEARIHEAAGQKFNVLSPSQLADILFKKLGMPILRRTKKGPSTDRSVLEDLRDDHVVPGLVLEFRELAKLRGTYIDALPKLINENTGRIHTSWNQTGAATGRLSSSEPNLQNIPIRTIEGKRIRAAFKAADGHLFVAADYSQMELRVMAHATSDPIMIETFLAGEDVHARTAREVFGDVNDDLRRRAKAVNFGIIYGLTKFGLARQLGIERAEAAEFIEKYLDRYSGVRNYMDRTIAFARKHGYVETLYGRRRQMLQINHKNRNLREGAERAAINAPIQGTAADVMKLAMIEVQRRLKGKGARIVAQIHDELLLEVPEQDAESTRALLVDAMQGAAEFQVPLAVEVGVGPTWADV